MCLKLKGYKYTIYYIVVIVCPQKIHFMNPSVYVIDIGNNSIVKLFAFRF